MTLCDPALSIRIPYCSRLLPVVCAVRVSEADRLFALCRSVQVACRSLSLLWAGDGDSEGEPGHAAVAATDCMDASILALCTSQGAGTAGYVCLEGP